MKQITFIDYACIKVKGGDGGNGARAFHREKYVDRGGPSGGDGGNGGAVILECDENENTLLDFKANKNFEADKGANGEGRNMFGKNGKDLIIKVPVGTQILENEKEIFDFSFHGQKWIAQPGGKGGRGNASFKSSKNLAPELYEHGEKPDPREFCLNLKVLADVGLLGYPNAGKSTLLSVISNAKPKIADYPFTTIIPQLGLVKHHDVKFVVTDLPGIIEGASEGKGMGHRFLKHLSRTKIILHLVDSTSENIMISYRNLRNELELYSDSLVSLKEIIVLTKTDLLSKEELANVKKHFKQKEIICISSRTNTGIKELLDILSKDIKIARENEQQSAYEREIKESDNDYVVINYEEDMDKLDIVKEGNTFVINSKYCRYWANRIPLTTHENRIRLLSKFKSQGIVDELKKYGLKHTDFIQVRGTSFLLEYDEDSMFI